MLQPLIFGRGDMLCGWNEPSLATVAGVPDCQVSDAAVEVRAGCRGWRAGGLLLL